MSAVTRVTICLFKPEGFEDTYFVNTKDRGLAVRTVMARYDAKKLSCINSVTANLTSPPNRESKDRIEANAPLLEPLGAAQVVQPDPSAAWWGVDLDGTLVKYENWIGPEHVGEPIPLMVERIKRWLSLGRQVKIFTARVYGIERITNGAVHPVYAVIEEFCRNVIGQVLPITCNKDYHMIELWDDRCVQVIPNTGERADQKDAPRFYIGGDDDGHDYLVPLEQRADWTAWEEHQAKNPDGMTAEEQERAWTPPEYARRIGGWSMLSFTDPKEF